MWNRADITICWDLLIKHVIPQKQRFMEQIHISMFLVDGMTLVTMEDIVVPASKAVADLLLAYQFNSSAFDDNLGTLKAEMAF